MTIPELPKDLVQKSMTLPELPKDLVEEILCRVPATSLKRLRSTCKRWNRLFKDEWGFAREHCDKAPKQLMVLMLTKHYRICPVSVNLHGLVPSVELKRNFSLPDPHYKNSYQFDIGRVLHCDGLLLCNPHDDSRIVVWNPFTGGTRWVEAGNHFSGGFCIVLGYSQTKKSCRKSYKLLSHYPCRRISSIYEFDSDSWRVIDHDIAPGWSVAYSCRNSVSLNGNINWFARHETKTISLLKFDFSTEKSERLPLPYQYCSYRTMNLAAVREEKLSVLLQRDIRSKTEIWVTNKIDETKVVSWTKVLALDLSHDLQISDLGSFLLDEEKKVLVSCDRWLDFEDETKSKDMIYIVGEDNKVITVDFGVDIDVEGWTAMLTYVPSLVQIERAQIKRAGGKRKRGD